MTSVVTVLDRVLGFYGALIIIYVLMSWLRPSGFLLEVFRVIGSIVEPYVGLFRRVMPATGMIDFSPLVAILVLSIVRSYLLPQLARL